jgi:hypothetical protein
MKLDEHASCDCQVGDCCILFNLRDKPGGKRAHTDVPYETASCIPASMIGLSDTRKK